MAASLDSRSARSRPRRRRALRAALGRAPASAVVDLGLVRRPSAKVPPPTRTTMNSCGSISSPHNNRLDHVQHRHRQGRGGLAAQVAVKRLPRLGRAAFATAATPRGSRSRRAGPCSECHQAGSLPVDRLLVACVHPATWPWISATSRPPSSRPSHHASRVARLPGWSAPVDAPEGAAARPNTRLRSASTSTVRLPTESRIWRPCSRSELDPSCSLPWSSSRSCSSAGLAPALPLGVRSSSARSTRVTKLPRRQRAGSGSTFRRRARSNHVKSGRRPHARRRRPARSRDSARPRADLRLSWPATRIFASRPSRYGQSTPAATARRWSFLTCEAPEAARAHHEDALATLPART